MRACEMMDCVYLIYHVKRGVCAGVVGLCGLVGCTTDCVGWRGCAKAVCSLCSVLFIAGIVCEHGRVWGTVGDDHSMCVS